MPREDRVTDAHPASLVVVAPHPDDEAIATGGTLLHYRERGVATHVITCTGGEAGDNLAGIDLEGRSLVVHRREEMAAAAALLGLASHTWLGYRDSGMAGTETNDHPEAFTNVDPVVAGTRLAGHLRRLRPQVVISDDEQGSYGHPDHVMAHRVAVAAVALAADPDAPVEGEPHQVQLHVAHAISMDKLARLHQGLRARGLLSPFGDGEQPSDFGVDPDLILTSIDVRDQLAAKHDVMLAHRSQVAADSAFFNVPDDLVADAWGSEDYIAVWMATPLDDAAREALAHDLFAGWLP